MKAVEFWAAWRNTLIVGGGSIACAVPLALLIAFLLLRTNVVGRRIAWIAVASQLIVPLYALVGAWSAGFGTLGWWPLAQASAIGSYPHSIAAVTFIHAVAAIPGCVLILSCGMLWSDRSTEELAMLEGGIPYLWRYALLPGLLPWMACACLWTMIPIMTEMVVTNLYRVSTLAEQVYLDISLGTMNSLTIFTAIVGSLVPLLIAALLVARSLPDWSSAPEQLKASQSFAIDLRGKRWAASLLLWLIVGALTLVPIANLIYKAGWQTIPIGPDELTHRWSLYRFGLTCMTTLTEYTDAYRWTAVLALGSTFTALSISILLRMWLTSPRSRAVMHFFCMALIAVPGPIVGLIITKLFLDLSIPGMSRLYDHTMLGPILAQQARLLPTAWLMTCGIVGSIPRTAWELAALDGLSRREKFRVVLWPETRSLWLLSALLLCALSAGELSTHLLLLPPGVTTVSQRLFELLHFGMRYEDSGLCLLLIAVGWLIAAAAWKTRFGFK
ncbi:MAG: hypothetical protein U0892_20665 [Pirellulales bacterium]